MAQAKDIPLQSGGKVGAGIPADAVGVQPSAVAPSKFGGEDKPAPLS